MHRYICMIKRVHGLSRGEATLWDELISNNDFLKRAFLTRDFVSAVDNVHPHVFVAVFYESERPVAFFPFQYKSSFHKFLGIADRVGSHMNDCFGLIATPGFHLSPEELLKAASLSGINFFCLDEEQKVFGLSGSIADKGWEIDLSMGPDTFFEHLKNKNRKYFAETKRRKKKLSRSYGPLKMEFPKGQRERTIELERLIEQKTLQYQRTGATDIFKIKWKKKLLFELSKEESERCSLLLAVLYAGDTWVGSFCGLKCFSKLHAWFPVYNIELRKFAPGHLLYWELIRRANGKGIQNIDRGVGNNEAKRVLGNLSSIYYRDVWIRSSVCGLVYRVGLAFQWRLRG